MKTLQRTIATLVLLAAAFALATPAPGAAPAKGTEILWDRYGIPHILRQTTPVFSTPTDTPRWRRTPNF